MSPARAGPSIVDKGFRALEALLVLVLAAMVVMVFANVVLRYGFGSGITVSEEISRFLFVWLIFLGSVPVMRQHGHLGVEMLVGKLLRRPAGGWSRGQRHPRPRLLRCVRLGRLGADAAQYGESRPGIRPAAGLDLLRLRPLCFRDRLSLTLADLFQTVCWARTPEAHAGHGYEP